MINKLIFLIFIIGYFTPSLLFSQQEKSIDVKNKGTIKQSVIGSNNYITKTQIDTIVGKNENGNDIVTFEAEGQKIKAEIGARVNIQTLIVGNYNVVNLNKVFYSIGKSVEYADLRNELEELEKTLKVKTKEFEEADSPKWKERVAVEREVLIVKIRDKEKVLKNFITDVITLAESFNKLQANSERLKKAKAFFDQGKFREANTVLNTKEMLSEGEYWLSKKILSDSLLKITAEEFMIKAEVKNADYKDEGRLDSIEYYYKQSLRFFKYEINLFEYADFLKNLNRLDSAIYFYEEAIGLSRFNKNEIALAVGQHNISKIYFNKKEYKKAEYNEIEALTFFKTKADSTQRNKLVIASKFQLAEIYYHLDSFDKAESLFLEVSEGNFEGLISEAIRAIYLINKERGNAEKASFYLEKAYKSIKFNEKDSSTYILNYANIFFSLGARVIDQSESTNEDLNFAIEYFKKAIAIRRYHYESTNPYLLCNDLWTLGIVCRASRRYEESEKFLLEGQSILNKWGKYYGDYSEKAGNFKEALMKLYSNAIMNSEDENLNEQYLGKFVNQFNSGLDIIEINGDLYFNLAKIFIESKGYNIALAALNLSLKFNNADPNIYFLRAIVYEEKNLLNKAFQDMVKCLELVPTNLEYQQKVEKIKSKIDATKD